MSTKLRINVDRNVVESAARIMTTTANLAVTGLQVTQQVKAHNLVKKQAQMAQAVNMGGLVVSSLGQLGNLIVNAVRKNE